MSLDIQAAMESLRTADESVRRELVEQLGRSQDPSAIPALLLAMADESWPVRQAAIAYLLGYALPELVVPLEAALRDDADAGLRNAAMEIFVKLGAGAVPPLLGLLGDEDEEIRNFAAVMLGAVCDPRAIEPLIGALGDSDLNVRHSAAASLGQLRAREAVPRLIDALTSEPWLQYPAINALGEIGEPQAVPALLGLLDDALLRGAVLDAVGRLAGREALPQLVPHLYDPDPVLRNMAIRAVVAIEERATAAGESLDPEVQAALRREDLVDHLILTLVDEDPQNRRTAAITLGWLREPRAVRPLVDLLGATALQNHATHALVSIGFREREPFEYGLAHPDDGVRQGTLRCLAWIAPAQGIELVAPMIHDPSTEVRAEAIAAIGRLGDEDAAMLLFEVLADESELIQESAMSALARLPSQQVVPLLLQAREEVARRSVRDGDAPVRVHRPVGDDEIIHRVAQVRCSGNRDHGSPALWCHGRQEGRRRRAGRRGAALWRGRLRDGPRHGSQEQRRRAEQDRCPTGCRHGHQMGALPSASSRRAAPLACGTSTMTLVAFTTHTASDPTRRPSSSMASAVIRLTTRCGPAWTSTRPTIASRSIRVTMPVNRLRADCATMGLSWPARRRSVTSRATSARLTSRWPPADRSAGSRPSSAHRRTVSGLTPRISAASPRRSSSISAFGVVMDGSIAQIGVGV